MTTRILAVDDEPDLLELVRITLTQSGFTVDVAATGTEALEALRQKKPDLVILDLMLPDHSGTEICRRIRADPDLEDLPVIMLTARSEEVDRVVGFELGADDYITKPFSPRELSLRVQAVLRRSKKGTSDARVLRHGDLQLDVSRRRCSDGDLEIELTAKEFDLLLALMKCPGRVLTREQILDSVWGSNVSVTLRTIDTHVRRLREKLGSPGSLIETVRGVGYRFTD